MTEIEVEATVVNLLKGSDRINEMKEEIEKFISITRGCFMKKSHGSNVFASETCSNGCSWSIFGVQPNLLFDVCFKEDGSMKYFRLNGKPSDCFVYVGRENKLLNNIPPSSLLIEDAQKIHASLEEFFKKLLKNRNFNTKKILFLLAASKL